MYDQQAFEKLKHFLETHPASIEAISHLNSKAEVGVVINNNMECTFSKKDDGSPCFAQKRPRNPDVVFFLTPEAIESLVHGEHENIAQVGINITKNYLAGTVKLRLSGSIVNIFTRGYLGVIKAGGLEYTRFLSQHGLTNLSKIKDFIIALKKK